MLEIEEGVLTIVGTRIIASYIIGYSISFEQVTIHTKYNSILLNDFFLAPQIKEVATFLDALLIDNVSK